MSAIVDNAPPGTPCTCDAPSPHDARWIADGGQAERVLPNGERRWYSVARPMCLRSFERVLAELLGEPPHV